MAIAKVRPMVGLRIRFAPDESASLRRSVKRSGDALKRAPTTLLLEYTPEPLRWMTALFGLADYTASDARRSGAGSSARDGVNDDSGPSVAENRMLVRAEGDIGSNYRRVAGSIGSHDQGKVRNISGGHTHVVGVAGGAVEMRAGGLEVRRFTLRVLMDVKGMLARRQAFDVQLDFHAMRRFAEHGGSNVLTLGILDFHGDRFGRDCAAGLHSGNAAGDNHKAHNTGNRFHRSSL